MSAQVRSDQDRIGRAPMKINIGGAEKPISPLVLRDSKLWKQQVVDAVQALAAADLGDLLTPGGAVSIQTLQPALGTLALRIPEQLEALVLGYLKLADPSLDQAWVREHITDEELTDALWLFITVTFPFFWKVGEITSLIRKARG